MTNAPNYEKEVRIASLAVQRASVLTKTIQNEIHRANTQLPDGLPVAIAHFASQVILINAILHHFPRDRFAGEKSASALRDDPVLARRVWALMSMAKLGTVRARIWLWFRGLWRRCWFLGPIDGTKTFIRGQQYAALATDACNAMICRPKDKKTWFPAWEHAGGMLIFESGGIVTDLYGRPFNYARGTRVTDNEGLVAAKPGLHIDLLRYLRHIYEKDLSSMT